MPGRLQTFAARSSKSVIAFVSPTTKLRRVRFARRLQRVVGRHAVRAGTPAHRRRLLRARRPQKPKLKSIDRTDRATHLSLSRYCRTELFGSTCLAMRRV